MNTKHLMICAQQCRKKEKAAKQQGADTTLIMKMTTIVR